ncbi:MAG TPA: HAMP domain-containing histidine kinase, partial [Gammaproteobacteria bacterium]|nr:HAMP domain-containing histidine kinase [Gammaproteobacteria bacterium]
RIEFAEKAKERLLHLERIVSEMLMFAKGDVIESQYTDVPGFMHQLKESFEMDDRIKNRRFILDENLKNVIIKAGHDVMLSVIQNIIDNAIDACDNSLNTKTACIEINASINRAGMFEIRVQDNGCGISHEMKEKIIQPFFTTKATGTGLGLAVVNATVNRYGGELAIESEEGVGSCFIVTFPAVDKPGLLPSNLLSRESSEKNGEFSATLAQITKNRRNNTQEVAL